MADKSGDHIKTELQKIPELADYDISEKTGFNVENPETELPDYFKPWSDIVHDLPRLIANKDVRKNVSELPCLDYEKLTTKGQRILAHTMLTYIGSAYVWQEGDRDAAKVVPRQLSIPWCALSDLVGLPPVVTLATVSLNNYRLIDPQGPLEIMNMDVICRLPGDDDFKMFCLIGVEIEIKSMSGIKAILDGMRGVVENDESRVESALNDIKKSIADITKSVEHLKGSVDPAKFYNVFRPFFAGWGGEGSPIPDGIIYEGVSTEPRKYSGGSQAQSTSIQCMDAGLGIRHPQEQQAYLDAVRKYMPRKHAEFIDALWNAPSIKEFVEKKSNAELRKIYGECVSKLRGFRTLHMSVANKFIVDQIKRNDHSNDHQSLEERGTGGTAFMVFLKSVRDSTDVMSADS
jgi:indoleamine 2,3-dioxygenase